METEASYTCQSCGETIVIPIDVTQGACQAYVEDCPVCCRPHLIRVQLDEDGQASVVVEVE